MRSISVFIGREMDGEHYGHRPGSVRLTIDAEMSGSILVEAFHVGQATERTYCPRHTETDRAACMRRITDVLAGRHPNDAANARAKVLAEGAMTALYNLLNL